MSSRTLVSFYVNRDDIAADAQFRSEARRSNARSDEVGQVDPRLVYDPGSAVDKPRLLLEPTAAIPFLPSLGVRFRF